MLFLVGLFTYALIGSVIAYFLCKANQYIYGRLYDPTGSMLAGMFWIVAAPFVIAACIADGGLNAFKVKNHDK